MTPHTCCGPVFPFLLFDDKPFAQSRCVSSQLHLNIGVIVENKRVERKFRLIHLTSEYTAFSIHIFLRKKSPYTVKIKKKILPSPSYLHKIRVIIEDHLVANKKKKIQLH